MITLLFMINKKLKELLEKYPDEAVIKIRNEYDLKNIETIDITYITSDDFSVPEIILG